MYIVYYLPVILSLQYIGIEVLLQHTTLFSLCRAMDKLSDFPEDVDNDDDSPLKEREAYKTEQSMLKRKLFKDDNNSIALDLSSNAINHDPTKVVKEIAVEDEYAAGFDGMGIPNANNKNTTEIINTGLNQPATVPVPVQTINTTRSTTCPTTSTEAEEIVRKLCKNGKVMEFQEGEDCIKVIVYEDSQEDSDKENNPR